MNRMTEGAESKSRSSAKPSFSPYHVDPANPVILSIQLTNKKMQRVERTYKPGFVPHSREHEGDHSSTTTVACAPLAAYPEVVTSRTDSASCLALRRAGFTEPSESPRLLVRSYRTVSPLPLTRREVAQYGWHGLAGPPEWPCASRTCSRGREHATQNQRQGGA
jgi:hypothetical protein